MARAIDRLMLLDAVLDTPGTRWLATEREKIDYFVTDRLVPPDLRRVSRSAGRANDELILEDTEAEDSAPPGCQRADRDLHRGTDCRVRRRRGCDRPLPAQEAGQGPAVEDEVAAMRAFLDANVLFSDSSAGSNIARLIDLLCVRGTAVSSDLAVEEARRNITLKRAAWLPAFDHLLRSVEVVPSALFELPVRVPPQGRAIALRSHPEPRPPVRDR